MHIEYLAKIQLITICIASTSFTKVLGGQNPRKFVEEDLLGNGAEFCHEAMIWIGKGAQQFRGQSRIYK